jgi:AcrR family transcriptional regulator
MPKVTQEHRDARKHEITSAVLRLVAAHGFQSTSMSDIIAESGLSAGAIYGHYKNKDELIQSAITELLDLRFANADQLDSDPLPDPGQIMLQFLSGIGTEMGGLGLLVQVWGQAVLDPSSRAATDRIGLRLTEIYEHYLRQWYGRGLGYAPDDAGRLAKQFAGLYLGIMQGYVVQSSIFGSFDGDAYLAAVSALRPDSGRPTG